MKKEKILFRIMIGQLPERSVGGMRQRWVDDEGHKGKEMGFVGFVGYVWDELKTGSCHNFGLSSSLN